MMRILFQLKHIELEHAQNRAQHRCSYLFVMICFDARRKEKEKRWNEHAQTDGRIWLYVRHIKIPSTYIISQWLVYCSCSLIRLLFTKNLKYDMRCCCCCFLFGLFGFAVCVVFFVEKKKQQNSTVCICNHHVFSSLPQNMTDRLSRSLARSLPVCACVMNLVFVVISI